MLDNKKQKKNIRSWGIILASSSFFFLVMFQVSLFNAINPYLFRELHFSADQISLFSFVFFLGNALFVFPAGILIDRYSVKKIELVSLFIFIVGSFVFATSYSFSVMLACRFVLGLVAAFTFLSSAKLAFRWLPPSQWALGIGIIMTIGTLGGLVAQVPFTSLVDYLGWRPGMLTTVFISIGSLILIYLAVSDFPDKQVQKKKRFLGGHFHSALLSTVTNRQNWLGAGYLSLINVPLFLLGGVWGSLFLTQGEGFSRGDSSIIVSMLFIGMICGAPLSGWISDRFGQRKKPMILGAVCSLIIVLLIAYSPFSFFLFWVLLFFLFGFLCGFQVLGYTVIAESNPPELAATSSSIGSLLLVTGGMLSPIFSWGLSLHWNHKIIEGMPFYSLSDYRLAMMVLVVGLALCFFFSLFIRETCSAE
ncbi:MAG: MFS transporter [Gammaproteobacteria bacterium]